ncbi:MAG TPA: alpha/beta hydrolase [Pyrinomonadaceae bacterium]|jgi:pimeloyl-ACP methyl ester carboxylesterase
MEKNFQTCCAVALILIINLSACVSPLHNIRRGESQRVDAGGHHLHMLIAGSGNSTVVLESGLGDTMESWAKVQPEVAKFSQVVAYDRAGLGQSEPGPKPRTAHQIANELHTALRNAGLAPPYVLVGHSAGGLYIRVFASMYPNEVAGMVFVDSTPEDFFERLKAIQTPEEQKKFEEKMQDYAARASGGRRDEWASLDVDLQQVRAALPLPKVPIILLTGMGNEPDKSPEAKQLWLRLHNEWLKQLPNAQHIIADNSGHYIQADEPGLVIDAIRRVIGRVRANHDASNKSFEQTARLPACHQSSFDAH